MAVIDKLVRRLITPVQFARVSLMGRMRVSFYIICKRSDWNDRQKLANKGVRS